MKKIKQETMEMMFAHIIVGEVMKELVVLYKLKGEFAKYRVIFGKKMDVMFPKDG